jgi:hypothetical protein
LTRIRNGQDRPLDPLDPALTSQTFPRSSFGGLLWKLYGRRGQLFYEFRLGDAVM